MTKNFCGRTRREFLWQSGCGFGGMALASLLGDDFFAQQAVAADGATQFANPLAPKKPHALPKAKSVIFLYMYGGPRHIATFDSKPTMVGMANKTITDKTFAPSPPKNQERIVQPRCKLQHYS